MQMASQLTKNLVIKCLNVRSYARLDIKSLKRLKPLSYITFHCTKDIEYFSMMLFLVDPRSISTVSTIFSVMISTTIMRKDCQYIFFVKYYILQSKPSRILFNILKATSGTLAETTCPALRTQYIFR